MQRLVKDAEAMNTGFKAQRDEAGNLTLAFSDVVTAIELIQEKQGIAGTTAKEAATTIEGAFNMTKAAWENLVAGLANPDADLGALMDNLIVAIVGDKKGEGLLNQLLPAVERALQGIGQFVQKAAPIISQYLPGLMSAILPGLLSAATSLVIGLAKALPSLIAIVIQQIPSIIAQFKNAVIEAAPALIEGGKKLMQSIYDGLTQAFPQIKPVLDGLGKIFETAFKAIGKVVDFFKKHFETIKGVVVAVGGAIAGIGLVGIIGSIAGAIGTVAGAIGGLISALSMIKSFAGLVSVITTLAGGPLVLIPALIGAIVAAVIYLWNTSETFRNFVLGLWAKIQEIVAGAVQVLSNLAAAFVAIGQDIINTVTNAWTTITTGVSTAIKTVQSIITSVFTAISTTISNIWNKISTTISSIWSRIRTTVSTAVNNVRTTIANVFSAISSKVSGVMTTIKTTISDAWTNAKETVSNTIEIIKGVLSDAWGVIEKAASGAWKNIKSAITGPVEAAKDKIDSIVKTIKGFFPISIGKWLKNLPKITLKTTQKTILGKTVTIPTGFEWHKKAMEQPFMFTKATIFGAGEAGDEMLYGREALLDDIRTAMRDVTGYSNGIVQNITINSPKQLNPSEVARQTRNSTRTLLMRMRTT